MDPETELIVWGTAAGVVARILGPTAAYLGDGMKTWTQTRIDNLRRIFSNAEAKLGESLNDEGAVPPRVLGHLLGEGSYASDGVAVEYFGGILASSRSGMSCDDRGAEMISLVSRLSAYALRGHYIVYAALRRAIGARIALHLYSAAEGGMPMRIYIPEREWIEAMDFAEDEDPDRLRLSVIISLTRESLIGASVATGTPDDLAKSGMLRNAPEDGLVFDASPQGVALFLWAHGKGTEPYERFNLFPDEWFTASFPIALPEHAALATITPLLPVIGQRPNDASSEQR